MADFIKPEKIKLITNENGEPINPRGPVRNTADLQRSIKECGKIIVPLSVAEEEQTGDLYLINGHRRMTAAKIMGLELVPFQVVHVGKISEDLLLDMMLATNVQEAFPAIVLDGSGQVVGGLAMAIRNRIEGSDRTIESLSDLMGMRTDVISAYFRLCYAPTRTQKAVASGRLSITAYSRIKYADPELQADIVGDGESQISVSAVVKKLKTRKAAKFGAYAAESDQDDDIHTNYLNEALRLIRLALTADLNARSEHIIGEIKNILEAK
jgi:ParB-like chromosome segregation protein Spo0J